jgi:acetyl esterase/lipase
MPGGIILASPTAEWTITHDSPDGSFHKNLPSDYCSDVFTTGYHERCLIGDLPADTWKTNVWISPGSRKVIGTKGLFSGFPPTCIVAGGAEIAGDAIRTLRDRIVDDNGAATVKYCEIPGGTHDVIAAEWCEPQRGEAFEEIAKWINAL